ncbi:hypothetical protein CGMCC3_g9936 [Colletotrichum fructicola]|nr:uncharacterized protein CGMCC3_g9936 [Colletotrichum fructicola]KAE9574186.1 hypothetical protein CGMCC3_g9936 [Colletotrichum fructicola]
MAFLCQDYVSPFQLLATAATLLKTAAGAWSGSWSIQDRLSAQRA